MDPNAILIATVASGGALLLGAILLIAKKRAPGLRFVILAFCLAAVSSAFFALDRWADFGRMGTFYASIGIALIVGTIAGRLVRSVR